MIRLVKRRARPGRPPQAQLWPVPAWLNAALVHVQKAETSLLKHLSLPFGLTVFAVVRNPSGADASQPVRALRGRRAIAGRAQSSRSVSRSLTSRSSSLSDE
jgi:hypothetical protein